jgi:protein-S-isoprenylcysteine O-methyltransferase Ste14
MNPAFLFTLFWGAWLLSWVLASGWSSPAIRRPASGAVWAYLGSITLGVLLIVAARGHWLPTPRLWRVETNSAQVLAFLTLPGFAFTWWARLHLGRLWSGGVARKDGHRIIDTGPYALVRHPIYTGLLEAALVSAIARGTVLALAGLVLMVVGIWLKARLEERFLSAELGAEVYGAYRRRVPMLFPWLPAT